MAVRMPRLLPILTVTVVLAVPGPTQSHTSQSSALWGASGQSYRKEGPLADFSWAGYHAGGDLPSARPIANVLDFGVRGDGKSDDTAAFQRAIDEAATGVLLVPRGRYRLAGQLNIRRSGLVLRGEGTGAEGTILQFSSSLADLQGLVALPETNKLSWSGGLIQVAPKGSEHSLTSVTQIARRGERRLRVADAKSIHSGDVLVLRLSEDSERSLEQHLLGEPDPKRTIAAPLLSTCAARILDWTFQVDSVDGDEVVISQPLRTDVRLTWAPKVWQVPFLHDVGIEHLVIDFPSTPYPGHHRERGYNAIDLSQNVVDAWVRDVEIRNCDSGLFVGRRSKWITVTALRFISSRPADPEGNQGHHGVALSGCSEVLVTDLNFGAEFVHEMTVTHRAMGNVFSGPVKGGVLDIDHHRDAPFENLFQNLSGNLHLQDGGSKCYGPPSGARNTYWGVDGLTLPVWLGSGAVVVGDLAPNTKEARSPAAWIEAVPGLEPRDLRAAQWRRRQVQTKPNHR